MDRRIRIWWYCRRVVGRVGRARKEIREAPVGEGGEGGMSESCVGAKDRGVDVDEAEAVKASQ